MTDQICPPLRCFVPTSAEEEAASGVHKKAGDACTAKTYAILFVCLF